MFEKIMQGIQHGTITEIIVDNHRELSIEANKAYIGSSLTFEQLQQLGKALLIGMRNSKDNKNKVMLLDLSQHFDTLSSDDERKQQLKFLFSIAKLLSPEIEALILNVSMHLMGLYEDITKEDLVEVEKKLFPAQQRFESTLEAIALGEFQFVMILDHAEGNKSNNNTAYIELPLNYKQLQQLARALIDANEKEIKVKKLNMGNYFSTITNQDEIKNQIKLLFSALKLVKHSITDVNFGKINSNLLLKWNSINEQDLKNAEELLGLSRKTNVSNYQSLTIDATTPTTLHHSPVCLTSTPLSTPDTPTPSAPLVGNIMDRIKMFSTQYPEFKPLQDDEHGFLSRINRALIHGLQTPADKPTEAIAYLDWASLSLTRSTLSAFLATMLSIGEREYGYIPSAPKPKSHITGFAINKATVFCDVQAVGSEFIAEMTLNSLDTINLSSLEKSPSAVLNLLGRQKNEDRSERVLLLVTGRPWAFIEELTAWAKLGYSILLIYRSIIAEETPNEWLKAFSNLSPSVQKAIRRTVDYDAIMPSVERFAINNYQDILPSSSTKPWTTIPPWVIAKNENENVSLPVLDLWKDLYRHAVKDSKREVLIYIDWQNIHVPLGAISVFIQELVTFAKKQEGVTNVRRLRVFLDRPRIPEAVQEFENAKIDNIEITHVETTKPGAVDTAILQSIADVDRLRPSDAIMLVSGDRDFSSLLARKRLQGYGAFLIYNHQSWLRFKKNRLWEASSDYLKLDGLQFLEKSKKERKQQKNEARKTATLQEPTNNPTTSNMPLNKNSLWQSKHCKKYQDETCTYSDKKCPFRHTCSSCDGDHPNVACTALGLTPKVSSKNEESSSTPMISASPTLLTPQPKSSDSHGKIVDSKATMPANAKNLNPIQRVVPLPPPIPAFQLDRSGKPKQICTFYSKNKCKNSNCCNFLHLCQHCGKPHSASICPFRELAKKIPNEKALTTCVVCNKEFNGLVQHRDHMNGKSHELALAIELSKMQQNLPPDDPNASYPENTAAVVPIYPENKASLVSSSVTIKPVLEQQLAHSNLESNVSSLLSTSVKMTSSVFVRYEFSELGFTLQLMQGNLAEPSPFSGDCVICPIHDESLDHSDLFPVLSKAYGSIWQQQIEEQLLKNLQQTDPNAIVKHLPAKMARFIKPTNFTERAIIMMSVPVWRDGLYSETMQLYKVILNTLKLAEDNDLKTLALPVPGVGSPGMPVILAIKILLLAILNHKRTTPNSKITQLYLFEHEKVKTFPAIQHVLPIALNLIEHEYGQILLATWLNTKMNYHQTDFFWHYWNPRAKHGTGDWQPLNSGVSHQLEHLYHSGYDQGSLSLDGRELGLTSAKTEVSISGLLSKKLESLQMMDKQTNTLWKMRRSEAPQKQNTRLTTPPAENPESQSRTVAAKPVYTTEVKLQTNLPNHSYVSPSLTSHPANPPSHHPDFASQAQPQSHVNYNNQSGFNSHSTIYSNDPNHLSPSSVTSHSQFSHNGLSTTYSSPNNLNYSPHGYQNNHSYPSNNQIYIGNSDASHYPSQQSHLSSPSGAQLNTGYSNAPTAVNAQLSYSNVRGNSSLNPSSSSFFAALRNNHDRALFNQQAAHILSYLKSNSALILESAQGQGNGLYPSQDNLDSDSSRNVRYNQHR